MPPMVLSTLLVLWCAAAAAAAGATGCPDPRFTQVGNECFYLSPGLATWSSARKKCQDMGGDLAIPDDAKEFKKFVFPAANVAVETVWGRGVWIGGTDQDKEGDWKYINDAPIPKTGAWSVDQPDDSKQREDCLEVRSYFHPPLNDYECQKEQQYVCEIDLPTLVSAGCPDPFTLFENECFYLSPGLATWSSARINCLGMGGDLAIPNDAIAFKFYVFPAANVAEDTTRGRGVWIGGTDQITEGHWRYLNGVPIPETAWYVDEPTNSNNKEHCLEIRSYFYPPLNDNRCELQQQYVCEIDLL